MDSQNDNDIVGRRIWWVGWSVVGSPGGWVRLVHIEINTKKTPDSKTLITHFFTSSNLFHDFAADRGTGRCDFIGPLFTDSNVWKLAKSR